MSKQAESSVEAAAAAAAVEAAGAEGQAAPASGGEKRLMVLTETLKKIGGWEQF